MTRGPQAGFTLIEAMISMAILLVSLLSLAMLQVVGTRANRFGNRMMQASALATDLEENIKRWDYADTRLNALELVTSLSHTDILAKWDMGTGATSSYVAEYSDLSADTNATTGGALGSTYQGVSSVLDGTASNPAFIRYWNVFSVDLNNDGVADGKFVQIIVRWKQPGFGYRQVSASTFRRNPASFQ